MLFDISVDSSAGAGKKSRQKTEVTDIGGLREKLKPLWADAREAKEALPLDIHQFIQVEMGLFLLETITPRLPATKLWWVIDSQASLHDISSKETQWKWKVLHAGRWKLWEWRNYRRWEEALAKYWQMSPDWRGYEQKENEGTVVRRTPAHAPERYGVYEKHLSKWTGVGRRIRPLAQPGRLFYERPAPGDKGKKLQESIDLRFLAGQNWWKKFADERDRAAEQERKTKGPTSERPSPRPPITVDLDTLVETARQMDTLWNSKLPKDSRGERLTVRNWEQRMKRIRLEMVSAPGAANRGFHPSRVLHIEETVHCAGVMGSGKSTLVEILAYWLVRQKRPVTIVLETTEQVLEWYDCFRRLEVPVVALLGKDRQKHLSALSQAMKTESSDFTGRLEFNHYGLEALSSTCLLEVLTKEKAGFLPLSQYPCERLYPWPEGNSPAPAAGANGAGRTDTSSAKSLLCPLYFLCPYHKMMQELPRSLLRLTTLSGLMTMWTPPSPANRQMYLSEWLIDNSDLLVIDEADRIQVELDDKFSSFQPLPQVVDALTAWLNRKNRQENEWVLEEQKNRLLSRQISHLSMAWDNLRAFIYQDEKREIIDWLKEINRRKFAGNPTGEKDTGNPGREGLYFTEWTLFGKLCREIVDMLETSLPGEKEGERESGEIARQKEKLEEYFWGLVNQIVDILPGIGPGIGDGAGHLEPATRELLKLLDFMTSPVQQSDPGARIQQWWEMSFWPEIRACCPSLPQLSQISTRQMEQWARRLHFTLLVAFFQSVLNLISYAGVFFDGEQEVNIFSRTLGQYLPAIPGPPMGNVIGFLMTNPDGERLERSNAISVVQCFGIGRWLLYHFHVALTENPGAHVLLLSATGWAGASEKFHLHLFPRLLLRAPADYEQKLEESRFHFVPIRVEYQGKTKALWVSGQSGEKRFEALNLVMNKLAAAGNDGSPPGLLEHVLRQLREESPDRQRIILVTGSYNEAEFVAKKLVSIRPDWSRRVACVKPPEPVEADPRQRVMNKLLNEEVIWLSRSRIPQFGRLPASVLVASLQSMERGHNIVDEHGKAVVGAVFFLVRPHPHPYDLSPAINCINQWGMERLQEMPPPEALTAEHIHPYREEGKKKWRRLVGRQMIYSRLPVEEREVLTWSTLVSILQLVGRLVRGGQPARAYFIDAAFDRQSAACPLPEEETQSRELLPAIHEVLGKYLDPASSVAASSPPELLHLVNIIYGFFFRAIRGMIGGKV